MCEYKDAVEIFAFMCGFGVYTMFMFIGFSFGEIYAIYKKYKHNN